MTFCADFKRKAPFTFVPRFHFSFNSIQFILHKGHSVQHHHPRQSWPPKDPRETSITSDSGENPQASSKSYRQKPKV